MKNALLKIYHLTNKKIEAMPMRERAILFALATVGLFLLIFALLIDPRMKAKKLLADKILTQQNQMIALQTELNERLAGHSFDPDFAIKTKITQARQRLQVEDAELNKLQKNLVPPEKMADLLESILKRNRALKLVSMRSLPALNLVEGKATPKESAKDLGDQLLGHQKAVVGRGIYKHEVELVLRGNYLDMLSYMRELEAMDEQVFWSRSSLQVEEYPTAILHLNLFTLSLEKKWLDL